LITIMSPEADIARLAHEARCGWNVTSGEELAQLVRELVQAPEELAARGRRGRELYERRFERGHVIREYVRVLAG
jgi:hypothetical protein